MLDIKHEKKNKSVNIKNLIHDFCVDNLNSELEEFCVKLCDTLERKKKINILRSTSEQWAASIVYVIARLNFLFDKKNECYITLENICDHFNTKKSTTANKATQIEQFCKLSIGTEGYCSEKIRDMFTFYKTESGFLISKSMIDNRIIGVEFEDEEEESGIKKCIGTTESVHEKRQREKQEHLADLKKRTKQIKENENQLGLFES
jgi:hypothetical protein